MIFIILSVSLSFAVSTKKESHLDRGIQQYNAQNFTQSIYLLQGSIQNTPNNSKIPLYIALNHLQLDQVDRAIAVLKQFLAINHGKNANNLISGHLVLLENNLNKKTITDLLRQNRPLILDNSKNNTLVVHVFVNSNTQTLNEQVTGLREMVIQDLRQISTLNVIDSHKIMVLYDELELNNNELLDQNITLMAGRILQAGYLITGKYQIKGDRIVIESSTSETTVGAIIGRSITSGELNQFFQVQKMLVFSILQQLGVSQETISKEALKRIKHIHTKNIEAFTSYSKAITATIAMDYQSARKLFKTALRKDNDFLLAKESLDKLPRTYLSKEEIITSIEQLADSLQTIDSVTKGTASFLPKTVNHKVNSLN